MTRGILIPLLIAAVGFVATDRTLAAERKIAGMQVTGSDATARFMALGISKSVVIDFPTDIQDVMVADKGIAVVVVQSKRRVYVIGAALGQTNVYFFDADGRQIDALDLAVFGTSLPAALEHYPFPANVVLVYHGSRAQTLSCTPIMCIDATKPGSDQPPGTQNINVTGSASAVTVTAGSK
jgi:hypothetical protein